MLNKRLITQLSGKMDPALRVAHEKAPLCVTRCSFGYDRFAWAKPHASCLHKYDFMGRFFMGNSNDSNSVSRP